MRLRETGLSEILMNLFSILITNESTHDNAQLPFHISQNIESFKRHHPGLTHCLYDPEAIRNFLAVSMERDVLWAFDQLLPYAYQADLARLCLLYVFDGVYADLSVCFHAPWNVLPNTISIFRDRAFVAPWIVSNSIIAAPARFAAIEAAIRMIVANCQNGHRGSSALCPTRPVLLGKAIAMHCSPEQIHLGEVKNVAESERVESLVFVDSTDRRLIGYRSKSQAGLAELGLHAGVNNYNDFYRAGVVYAADFPITFPAGALHVRGQSRCEFIGDDLVYRPQDADAGTDQQVVMIGNFLPFNPGTYTVSLEVSKVNPGAQLTLIALCARDADELGRASITFAHIGLEDLLLQFTLSASRDDINFALFVRNCQHLNVAKMQVFLGFASTTPSVTANTPSASEISCVTP